jgi:hypothetical protein
MAINCAPGTVAAFIAGTNEATLTLGIEFA